MEKLRNRTMGEMLASGECRNVREVGVINPANASHFKLSEFVAHIHYCDPVTEQWIWSVGRHCSSGDVIASVQADLYDNPDFECLALWWGA